MSHLNYNHLYYFWMVCKQGSVTKAAQALFLTPQTVTGQIKALEARMDGQLMKRAGRRVEPTHELLLEQLSQHKLDMILFDCPVDSARSPGLFSKKLGENQMCFFSYTMPQERSLIECLSGEKILIPGSRTAMGRSVIHWFDSQGIQPNIMVEFDDVALMKAFAREHREVIF